MDKVVHFEIPFDKIARAIKFYADTRITDSKGTVIGIADSSKG